MNVTVPTFSHMHHKEAFNIKVLQFKAPTGPKIKISTSCRHFVGYHITCDPDAMVFIEFFNGNTKIAEYVCCGSYYSTRFTTPIPVNGTMDIVVHTSGGRLHSNILVEYTDFKNGLEKARNLAQHRDVKKENQKIRPN